MASFTGQAASQARAPLRTTLTRASAMERVRAQARGDRMFLADARARLLRDAETLAAQPMVSVTDKATQRAPSDDPHDYLSLSPYWWPDSTKPGGLPYVRRDGVTNPESKRDLDQPRVSALGERVQAFALAWWITGDRKWSLLASQQVRAWFIAPATRMTPHLRYAQLIRGRDAIRGTGIIDGRDFMEVTDALGLIADSPDWTSADDAALRRWFGEYLTWLKTSEHGVLEYKATNNHGSWFSAQAATVALFVGDSAYAKRLAEEAKTRIGSQITAAGLQPQEMERTRSMHYSVFNIEALSRLAEVGAQVGVDLWHHEDAMSGGSLVKTIDFVGSFAGREEQWPAKQIAGVNQSDFIQILARARAATGRASFDQALARLPATAVAADRAQLLFWRAP